MLYSIDAKAPNQVDKARVDHRRVIESNMPPVAETISIDLRRDRDNLQGSTLVTIILTVIVAFLSFGVTSAFAGTLTEPDSLVDLLNPIRDAISSDKPYLACALMLVLVAALARRYGSRYWGFLSTSLGGSLVVLIGSFGGALAVPLTEMDFSLPIIWPALKTALIAAGGFSLLKPIAEFLGDKFPWMKPVTALVAWIYAKPNKVKAATDAGAEAVNANPPNGASGIVGEPKRVE